jgi:type VI secretion system secreted protein VgrG
MSSYAAALVLGSRVVEAVSASIGEQIGSALQVRALCPRGPWFQAAAALLGLPAELELSLNGAGRSVLAVVDRVLERDAHIELHLQSAVGRLALSKDYRVFVNKSAVEVTQAVHAAHEIQVESRLAQQPPRRAQLVQSFESDLSFCARVLAEEGIAWCALSADASAICLVDSPSGFGDRGLRLQFVEDGGLRHAQAVSRLALKRRVVEDVATLRDFDFRHPHAELGARAGKGALEWYEHPAGLDAGFDEGRRGDELARIRREELGREELVLEGVASSVLVAAGESLTLWDAPLEAMNGRWLVFEARHELQSSPGATGLAFEVHFRAVPASRGFRPRRSSLPIQSGLGTAVATGASGQEIAVDAYGRTTFLHRWDRRGRADQTASSLARVAQPQLAGGIFNPRVGWEEVVAFGADAASAFVLGRVYNGSQPPPATLPDKMVETHFGTLTTPRGAGGNAIVLHDTKGREQMSIVASGNYEEQTEKDKVTEIGGSHARTVGADRKLIIGERFAHAVLGAQTITVRAVRTVTTDSNYFISVPAESIQVGGLRLFHVGGDYTTKAATLVRVVVGAKAEAPIEHQSVFVSGPSTLVVTGSLSTRAALAEAVGVGGACGVKIAGAKSIDCTGYNITTRGGLLESFASRTMQASGKVVEVFSKANYHFKGGSSIDGAEIAIEAMAKLSIEADGLKIVMTPGSIEIQGKFDGGTASVEDGMHSYG